MFFSALGAFAWGILKRFYLWAPSALLDPFDIYNKYIRPFMLQGRQGRLDMPSEAFPWVLMGGLLWAGFMTYRELYVEAKQKKAVVQADAETVLKELREVSYEGDNASEYDLGTILLAIGEDLSAGGLQERSLQDALKKLGGSKLSASWKKVVAFLRARGVIGVNRLESRGGYFITATVGLRENDYITTASEEYYFTDVGAKVYGIIKKGS